MSANLKKYSERKSAHQGGGGGWGRGCAWHRSGYERAEWGFVMPATMIYGTKGAGGKIKDAPRSVRNSGVEGETLR